MFRGLRLQNENKIAEFLTEKFFGSKSNLTNRALVSLKSASFLPGKIAAEKMFVYICRFFNHLVAV